MRENWRETLPNPANVSDREKARQRQRAEVQAARMRQALDDIDRPRKRGHERRNKAPFVVVGVVIAALIFGAVFVCVRHAAAQASASESVTTETLDVSKAGANAVTLEELEGDDDSDSYTTDGWKSLTGYSPTWDVVGEGDGVTLASSSEGPIYDLPVGWTSFTAHDKATNRSYTVIVNDVGAFQIIPTLDADGNQVITERY